MAQSYLNKKQELFAKFLAQGSTQLEAYELAGYQPNSANANTLSKHPLVKERVAELKEEFQARENEFRLLALQAENSDAPAAQIEREATWTFQRIMDMMGENVRLAQIAGEYKAANECLKMMAEAMKMFEGAVEKGKGKGELPPGPMTLIGQVTNILETAGEATGNALAPRPAVKVAE